MEGTCLTGFGCAAIGVYRSRVSSMSDSSWGNARDGASSETLGRLHPIGRSRVPGEVVESLVNPMPRALVLALVSPLPIIEVPSTASVFVAAAGADDALAHGLARQVAIDSDRVVRTMLVGHGLRGP